MYARFTRPSKDKETNGENYTAQQHSRQTELWRYFAIILVKLSCVYFLRVEVVDESRCQTA